jgi:threonylcarbamoyladenosine tRNA methylthiotransferase MtaB
VERLVREVPAVRFRLSSIEATEVDERLTELLASEPGRLAPHLHAPLQSGSDRLLRRMGRHWYTACTYAASVERLVGLRSVFGLGADIIVGFPGETEADFEATLQLVEQLPFTYLHVFPFSARPGTAAPRLPDPVSPSVVKERSSRLRALGEAKAASYRARRVGGAADAIVVTGAPRREAVTEDYLTVGVAEPRFRGERFTARLAQGTEALVTV